MTFPLAWLIWSVVSLAIWIVIPVQGWRERKDGYVPMRRVLVFWLGAAVLTGLVIAIVTAGIWGS